MNWSVKLFKSVRKPQLRLIFKIGVKSFKWKFTSRWSLAPFLKKNSGESLRFMNLLKEKCNYTKNDKPLTLLQMELFQSGYNKKSFSISYSQTTILSSLKNQQNSLSIFTKGTIKCKSTLKWSGNTEKENTKLPSKKSTILLLKFPPMTEINNSQLNSSKSTFLKSIKTYGIQSTLRWLRITLLVLCSSLQVKMSKKPLDSTFFTSTHKKMPLTKQFLAISLKSVENSPALLSCKSSSLNALSSWKRIITQVSMSVSLWDCWDKKWSKHEA